MSHQDEGATSTKEAIVSATGSVTGHKTVTKVTCNAAVAGSPDKGGDPVSTTGTADPAAATVAVALTADALEAFGSEVADAIDQLDWETASSTAYEALGKLRKSDIVEVKSFLAPPRGIDYVMMAVAVCLGEKVGDWGQAKKLLADKRLLQRLLEFDPQAIDARMLKKLDALFGKTDEAGQAIMTIEGIRNKSIAAAGLCAWVLAVHEFGSAQVV